MRSVPVITIVNAFLQSFLHICCLKCNIPKILKNAKCKFKIANSTVLFLRCNYFRLKFNIGGITNPHLIIYKRGVR